MPKKAAPKSKKITVSEPAGLAAKSSRPPVVRMIKIHEALSAGKYPNCSKLADEFEVSTKTMQRDLEFMRDQLNLPIAYDAVRHGYFYEGPVAQFPMVTVSQGELVALLVAQKAVEQYKGTPFQKPLQAAFDKLVSSLGEEESISLHELSDAVSFRSSGVPEGQIETFELLADAVMRHERVEFDYKSPQARKPARRRVNPYHLACIDNQWYLIAWDLERDARRTFAVTRIEAAKNLREKFEKPVDFSAAEMLAGSFSAFEAGRVETIRIRFSPVVASLIRERQWHKSQKVRSQDDGGVELTMKVGVAPDLEAWILGWGGQAEVLEPAALRERIGRMGAEIAQNNAAFA